MNKKNITKNIGSLIATIKRLEPELRDCDENLIITICLSNRINDKLKFVIDKEVAQK